MCGRPPSEIAVAGRWLTALALACSTAGGAACGAPQVAPESTGRQAAERPPSVLLLTLDTTRADHLEPYGAAATATPALAELARRGVVFERAYAVTPVTLPSHASLLTGVYPPQHGIRHNGIHYLESEQVTLAERLRDVGYRTAAFVSAAVLERRYGLDQGFEFYDDRLAGAKTREQRMMVERPAAATVDAALSWLDGVSASEAFFLWVHLFDPHTPYAAPGTHGERYRENPYDGEIAYMDANIGRLLAHRRVAPAGDTLVTAIGDHGESLGDHGEKTHGILVYEATMRIPWILHAPGGPSGLRVGRPVSQVDLVPTLLELLDLPVPAGKSVAGVSLAPLGGADRDSSGRAIYGESHVAFHLYGWSKLRALWLDDHQKFIDAPLAELYDLARDPGEQSNLALERVEVVRRAARQLAESDVAAASDAPAPRLLPDAAASAKLRSLGYLAAADDVGARGVRPDPKAVVGLHDTLQRVEVLLANGRHSEALTAVRPVLAADPENLSALKDLAKALSELGRHDDAVAAAARALSLAPESATAHLTLAALEFRRGDGEEALALAERALELDPDSLEAKLEKARFLALAGRSAEAAELLEVLVEEKVNSAWVEVRYAELVEIPRGELEAAESRLRRVVERDPQVIEAWLLLGELIERSGRGAAAAEVYRRALEIRNEDPELLARRALLLAATDGAAAESALRAAIALAAEPAAELHIALAEWLTARGRAPEARAAYERAASGEAADRGARNEQARALAALGRPSAAQSIWQDLATRHPDFAPPFANLGALALVRRDWRQAERWARQALAVDGALATAWNSLGIALEEMERDDEALAAYGSGVEADASYWQAGFNLGLLLERLGRYAEAAAAFERVLSTRPQHAGALYHLGLLHAGPLANGPAARRYLEAALTSAPDHPRAAQARRLLAERRAPSQADGD